MCSWACKCQRLSFNSSNQKKIYTHQVSANVTADYKFSCSFSFHLLVPDVKYWKNKLQLDLFVAFPKQWRSDVFLMRDGNRKFVSVLIIMEELCINCWQICMRSKILKVQFAKKNWRIWIRCSHCELACFVSLLMCFKDVH